VKVKMRLDDDDLYIRLCNDDVADMQTHAMKSTELEPRDKMNDCIFC
jgi:hypothetical protein